jgi:membrane carboxypeptidase/penicillin-binding protein PbpC
LAARSIPTRGIETAYEGRLPSRFGAKCGSGLCLYDGSARYTKAEILTIYLNHRAYLGALVGSSASQQYFRISAIDVNPAQSAMLAGLLKGPSSFANAQSASVTRSRRL